MLRLALFALVASLLPSAIALGAENDLSVGWIARTPRIDYVWNSSNPTVEGWPAPGAAVTWVANVRWLGSEPLHGVSYRWTIDGEEVRIGKLDFAPGSLVQAELPWSWTFARHQIAFEIDTDHQIAETEERNNRVMVNSNAIGVGIYVERGFWNGIQPQLKAAGIGANTFDDWMQREANRLNEMAQYAITPDTPAGVLDRWRIDDIHLVEDNTLPLAPPYAEARDWGAAAQDIPTLYPNVLDHTVDVQWGFPAYSVSWWSQATGVFAPWIFTIGTSLLHEWQHARTMIDTYAWNLSSDADFIHFSPAPPPRFGISYYNAVEHGMMNLEWGHFDPYTAAALNQMTGRRAVRGNYNEPWDLGWFLNDFPAQNRLRLLRTDGTPIKNRKVTLYRATGEAVANWQSGPYPMTFDSGPGTTLTTDGEGRILVGHNPFTDGTILALVEKANGTAILRIDDGSTTRWAFIESLQFNLAYWRGQTNQADYDVIADGPPCFDSLGPESIEPPPESVVTTRNVSIRFLARTGLNYELWWAANRGEPVKVNVPPILTGTTEEVTLPLPDGRIVWWFVEGVSNAPCPATHSSLYGFDHLVEQPRRRTARP